VNSVDIGKRGEEDWSEEVDIFTLLELDRRMNLRYHVTGAGR